MRVAYCACELRRWVGADRVVQGIHARLGLAGQVDVGVDEAGQAGIGGQVDVAGAGHMVAGDRNDLFDRAVVSFLESVRAG